jgi:hypothetical protein
MGKFTNYELKAVVWFKGGYTLPISGLYDEAIERLSQAVCKLGKDH